MKRLQVGGLALIVGSKANGGKVCKLLCHLGDYKIYKDAWRVKIEDGGLSTLGRTIFEGACPSSWLMPLGDDYTQEILKKEKVDAESVGELV